MPSSGVWPSRMVRDGEESFAGVKGEWKASLRDKGRGLMGGVGGTTCGLSSNDIPGSWILSVGVDAEEVCKKPMWGGGQMVVAPETRSLTCPTRDVPPPTGGKWLGGGVSPHKCTPAHA